MIRQAGFRGQPLVLLGVLIAGWVALRVATWQVHFQIPFPLEASRSVPDAPLAPGFQPIAAAGPIEFRPRPKSAAPQRSAAMARPPAYATTVLPAWTLDYAGPVRSAPVESVSPAEPVPLRAAIGHNLMLLAGLAQMEVPPAILAYFARQAAPTAAAVPTAALARAPGAIASRASRWSADGWVLWREAGGAASVAAVPSYGRSQAGAVVRYRLDDSGRRPQAYARASSALGAPREHEVAAGLSVRPVIAVPLRLAVEGRVSTTAIGSEVRPAVFAITEVPPVRLPGGLRGEVYAQAGYVGGRFATPFLDGQARIDRTLATADDFALSAGAGAWGGAQKGAARLDVGPSAAVSFRLGEARGRLSADYRFRVAGDAAPASGPAVTLSAGF